VDVIYHVRSTPPPRMKRRQQDFGLPLWLERALAGWVRWTNYDDYLQSIVWRSKRQRALRRAEYACQICNSRQRLEVHHREYPTRWGFEPDNDITVLCAACHRRHHGL